MKNTVENKAKFFAQYFGQNVLCYFFRDGVYEKERVEVDYPILECIDNYKDAKLELKPLSQISDEEKTILEESIIGFIDSFYFVEQFCYANIKSSIYGGLNTIKLNNYHVDYLRSKGYILPWNGITVEEMVEFGWVKLKE